MFALLYYMSITGQKRSGDFRNIKDDHEHHQNALGFEQWRVLDHTVEAYGSHIVEVNDTQGNKKDRRDVGDVNLTIHMPWNKCIKRHRIGSK